MGAVWSQMNQTVIWLYPTYFGSSKLFFDFHQVKRPEHGEIHFGHVAFGDQVLGLVEI